MKNVILYCRVSSDEQKTNTSLDFQEKKLREYCDKHGYNVVECYHEDFSGKHHDFVRPEMKKIRDYCKKHKHEVDLILFLRWDRFSRNPEFAYMFKRIFMDEWGINFNAIESPIDFSATEWSTLLSNYCAAAHTENNKISRRTRDGIRETMLSGRWANSAPRGYKNVHIVDGNGITIAKTIEIDEENAPMIRAIFNEVAKGVEAPCSIRRRIAPNIPESTFLDILRNIFYKGKIRVPATKTEPEVIVQGLHTPLVTEELFDTVQEIMDGKRKKHPKLTKPIKPEFYLRKYLVCPHCGRAITGAFSTGGSGGKYPYYFCPTTGQHLRVSAETVNNAFVHYVSSLRPNEAIMQLYLEVINDLRKENMRDIRTLIDGLDKEIWGVRERMNSIEDKYLDKEINHEDYNRMISRQKDKLKSLQDRKELLETPNRGRIEPQLRYSMTLIDNIDKFFEYAPADNKIRLLSSIFPEKIEYDGKIFRTENLNSVLSLVYLQTNELRGLKKENEESFSTFPASVPRAGVEPAQG
ncbi:MAG: recombinase family protein [Alistipes sp.]|nr:recombinase family protein [Alistipes sp.]